MKANESAQALNDGNEPERGMAESDVIDFLKANPDFFRRHEQLLCEMHVPHRAGAAVSLVERQVTLLRERNIDMRHRLARIVETARNNDRLFGKTREVVLYLLEQSSRAELVECARKLLRQEVGADFCSIILFRDADISPEQQQLDASLRDLFKKSRSLCGPLRSGERAQLFAEQADAVESAAVVPMLDGDRLGGILALGSSDPDYFQVDMGTLFLDFIADVLVRRLRECPAS